MKAEHNIPLIAEKDITCYKLVYKMPISKSFRSQFREFRYWLNCEMRVYSLPVEWQPTTEGLLHQGFHSYRTLAIAKRKLKWHDEPGLIIMRCVIPKGARYFKGTGAYSIDNNEQYCSELIRPVGYKDFPNDSKWKKEFPV